mmetsp:Transcript_3627/g.7791  ORF Transcript_3627/g.7791 Transcript_3627/m.7791 type:complete len:203 (-) Transcript_3627:342-950(-)
MPSVFVLSESFFILPSAIFFFFEDFDFVASFLDFFVLDFFFFAVFRLVPGSLSGLFTLLEISSLGALFFLHSSAPFFFFLFFDCFFFRIFFVLTDELGCSFFFDDFDALFCLLLFSSESISPFSLSVSDFVLEIFCSISHFGDESNESESLYPLFAAALLLITTKGISWDILSVVSVRSSKPRISILAKEDTSSSLVSELTI